MPVLRRRPLRERRNVQLKVATTSSLSKELNDNNDDGDIKSIVKHKAKAPSLLRAAARRSRLSNGHQSKLAPGSRVPYVPQQHTPVEEHRDEPAEASKKAVEQQTRPKKKKKTSAPAPLSLELNLDVDHDIELENSDPFPAQSQFYGYHHAAPSSNPASPTFLQDVFTAIPTTATQDAYHQSEIDEASYSLAYEEPTTSFYAAGEEDLQSMHEFLPFLFIAFSDGQYTSESLKASYGIDFTHVLKIAHPSMATDDDPGCISSDVNYMTGMQTLTLTIPSPHHSHSRTSSTSSAYGDILNASPSRRRAKGGRRHARTGISQRMFTLLSEEQLLAARDFLSLALPYYLEARPTTKKTASENVAVLVTAPGGGGYYHQPALELDAAGMDTYGFNNEFNNGYVNNDNSSDKGGAADVISAIACYLSFASETPVETVLSYVDEEECLGDEWKDAISRDEDGVGFVQQVAAM